MKTSVSLKARQNLKKRAAQAEPGTEYFAGILVRMTDKVRRNFLKK